MTAFNIDFFVDRLIFAEEISLRNLPINIRKIAKEIFNIEILEAEDLLSKLNLKSLLLNYDNDIYIFYKKGLSDTEADIAISKEVARFILSTGEINQNNILCPMIERTSRALLMPKYLLNQMENAGYTRTEIINKFGLSEQEGFANRRFSDLDATYKMREVYKMERRIKRLQNKNSIFALLNSPILQKFQPKSSLEREFFAKKLEFLYKKFEEVIGIGIKNNEL